MWPVKEGNNIMELEAGTGLQLIVNTIQWVASNSGVLLEATAWVVFAASLVVRATPTLRDDNWFKPLLKFAGKVSLDKYGPKGDERLKKLMEEAKTS